MKKFICTVCGYVYEGEEAPEFCPQCKVPRSKFKELVETEGALTFADEHVIGVAKGVDAEVLEGLKAHFTGECTEVGMYLAMSRQADREGYPEVAEAFKRYAWEEAEHAAKFCELLGECVWDNLLQLLLSYVFPLFYFMLTGNTPFASISPVKYFASALKLKTLAS